MAERVKTNVMSIVVLSMFVFFGEGIVDLVLGCSHYWIDCKAELLYVCLFIVLSIDVVQVWCKVKAVSVIEKSVK